MLNRVFETDGLAKWNGHRKLFLQTPASTATNPARYLVAITSAMVGWMDRRGVWRSDATEVISFSEAKIGRRHCCYSLRSGGCMAQPERSAWCRTVTILYGPFCNAFRDGGEPCATPKEQSHSARSKTCRCCVRS